MKKITKRERYIEIIDLAALAEEQGFEGFDFEGMVTFCKKEIAALDRKATKAKEVAATKREEADKLLDVVADCLTSELEPIATITERVAAQGYEDVTVGKITYRLSQLVKAGTAVRGEFVIPATETTKKRTVSGFARVSEP